MVDPRTTARMGRQLIFLALVAAILFVRLLPLDSVPSRWPAPDLILCLTFAWLLRRSAYVPVWIIALVFLTDDLLSMRPPGLWTMIVLAGTEFLRPREANFRDMPFLLEWAMTGIVFTILYLANWAILSIFLVPHAGFAMTLMQALTTIAAYPLVVAACLALFGLRKTAKGEVDALGHRL